jgi:hypothetical protein
VGFVVEKVALGSFGKWKVRGRVGLQAAVLVVLNVRVLLPCVWFFDAFTKRKRTRNVETRSVKQVNPHCSFMLPN